MKQLPVQASTFAPANTTDYLEYNALKRRDKLALRYGDLSITYGQLYTHVMLTTVALREFGLEQGMFVLVSIQNIYHHLLVLLACENLRLSTASIQSLDYTELFKKADSVLSDKASIDFPVRLVALDESWFASTLSVKWNPATSFQREPSLSGDVYRVIRSSGTTGVPKVMCIARWQFEESIHWHIKSKEYSPGSIFLVAYGLDVYSIWTQLSACLRLGATVLLGKVLLRLNEFDVTHIWILPNAVSNLLRQLPADWKKPKALRLFTGGAHVSDALKTRALDLLCIELINMYASNETGTLSWLDDDNKGYLFPGVMMKIVDESGNEVVPGQSGEIALKVPGMVLSYWDQPEYTAHHFRDGWFYPGDRGKALGFRHFQLLGRNDEMLNIGGVKQPPEYIERVVCTLPMVREAAATTAFAHDGSEFLVVAVVLVDPNSLPQVQREVAKLMPSLASSVYVFACPSLPRTSNGKIMRQMIRDAVESSRNHQKST